jgi:hypothetical protein
LSCGKRFLNASFREFKCFFSVVQGSFVLAELTEQTAELSMAAASIP